MCLLNVSPLLLKSSSASYSAVIFTIMTVLKVTDSSVKTSRFQFNNNDFICCETAGGMDVDESCCRGNLDCFIILYLAAAI